MKSGRPCVIIVSCSKPYIAELKSALVRMGYAVSVLKDASALVQVGISPTVVCTVVESDNALHPYTQIAALMHSFCCDVPIVALCTSPTIPLAVSLIKSGAADVIDARSSPDQAAAQVRRIASFKRANPANTNGRLSSREKGPLTAREVEVLEHVIAGLSSKEIAKLVGVSHRTVGDHRARIMKKFEVRNAPALIRKIMKAGTEKMP